MKELHVLSVSELSVNSGEIEVSRDFSTHSRTEGVISAIKSHLEEAYYIEVSEDKVRKEINESPLDNEVLFIFDNDEGSVAKIFIKALLTEKASLRVK